MRFERFKQVVEHNRLNQKEMLTKVQKLYQKMRLNYEEEILNLEFIIKPLFEQEEYLILEMPFRDKEIGAICYKGDCYGYIFLNSALPKVNVNFALAHEIYHVFYQCGHIRHKVEFNLSEHYSEDKEELAANLFAGMLLMPTTLFVTMFRKFQLEQGEEDTELTLIAKLMSFFQVPYMAVVIRCYELNLLSEGQALRNLLEVDGEQIQTEFDRLWLNKSILEPTFRDNYPRLEQIVKNVGGVCKEKVILTERTVEKVLTNIQRIYQEIRGGCHEGK